MAHPTFNKAVTNPVDLVATVRAYRSAQAALRRLAQSKPTRNAGATERAIKRHQRVVHQAELALTFTDNRALLGALNDEAKLLVRLATAKNLGQDRPELKVRLKNDRAAIRKLAKV